jgi:NAD(P)-dependent dehydrogenase (short-subunit alcohol dehydrogenase family)
MKTKRTFKDKTVIITGAAGGFGRAFARRFGREGARLGLLDLNQAPLRELEKELQADGIECVTHPCDVTDYDQCKEAFGIFQNRLGGIDCLINNAGLTHRSAFTNTEPEVYRKVMDVNLFGSIHCSKLAIDSLIQRRGIIIVISSLAGFLPLYGRTGYSASKHALHGFFDSLRTEMKSKGVSVMIACPGFADTDFSQSALDGDGTITRHPRSTVGKLSTAEEIAQEVFKAATQNKRLLVMSPAGKASRLIIKMWPPLYDFLMARSLKSELERGN